jgi:hypothetical protein
VLLIFLSFVLFFVLSYDVFTFWVPCCDVRDDCHIKAIFVLSLPPVVCRMVHIIHVICAFLRIVVSNTYHIVLCFSSSCVPYIASSSGLSIYCIAPSVFKNRQSRETANIGYTKHKTKTNKTKKQNTMYVVHHSAQTNTNNLNKTWNLLQTSWDKAITLSFDGVRVVNLFSFSLSCLYFVCLRLASCV